MDSCSSSARRTGGAMISLILVLDAIIFAAICVGVIGGICLADFVVTPLLKKIGRWPGYERST
jgi:hypothetical protein